MTPPVTGGVHLISGKGREKRMAKTNDKLFEELFPASAVHFAQEVALVLRGGDTTHTEGRYPSWFCVWVADSLLRRATSWREEWDLFSSYAFSRIFVNFSQERHVCNMTKRKEVIRDDQKAEWKGFVDRRLTDDELAALDEWKPKPSEIWAEVDQLTQDGYRLTLTYNKRTKLSSCTIIDDNPTRKSGGYALSNADGDGALALKMAVFKHVHLLDRTWENLLSAPPRARRG